MTPGNPLLPEGRSRRAARLMIGWRRAKGRKKRGGSPLCREHSQGGENEHVGSLGQPTIAVSAYRGERTGAYRELRKQTQH